MGQGVRMPYGWNRARKIAHDVEGRPFPVSVFSNGVRSFQFDEKLVPWRVAEIERMMENA
jgi:hypothetical protein